MKTLDVRTIGPQGSAVGFAALNGFVFRLLGGYHPFVYRLTEALGILSFAPVFGFALLGLCQLLRRRSLKKVDPDILLLGAFYVLVGAVYLIFKYCAVNYRPVDLGTGPEASYPSSHTVLAVCVMSTTISQVRARIQSAALRKWTVRLCCVLMVLIVAGRLLSGVHWCIDIVGALLLSATLLSFYRAAAPESCGDPCAELPEKKKKNEKEESAIR